MKQTKPAKPGEHYKIKRCSITTKYGIRCSSDAETLDNRIWPGEMGIIEEHKWKAWDGSDMSGMFLVFSRGRQKALREGGFFDDDLVEYLIKVNVNELV